MVVYPSGVAGKHKFADRFMENKVKIAKSLIPEGPFIDDTLVRIGRSLHFYETCQIFSENTFGVPHRVC
jgi:hypothetical protein